MEEFLRYIEYEEIKIQKARDAVSRLCNGEKFQMQIPVNPETDHDCILSEGLNAGAKAVKALRALEPVLKYLKTETRLNLTSKK